MFIDDIDAGTAIEKLKLFLPQKSGEQGPLSYFELEGFLFGVCCAPELIMPSEWLDVVWRGEPPSFASDGESEAILGAIMALYNEINTCIIERRPCDACTAIPRLPPLSNFDSDAPLRQWSSGFALSQYWLRAEDSSLEEELQQIDEEIADDYMFSYMALSFFSSRGFAEKFFKETDEGDLDEVAGKFIKAFEGSLKVHARVGMAFRGPGFEADELDEGHDLKVGRNDPCPCGSGRKYKKCCGA